MKRWISKLLLIVILIASFWHTEVVSATTDQFSIITDGSGAIDSYPSDTFAEGRAADPGLRINDATGNLQIGADIYSGKYYIIRSYLVFDTSSIPDDATVTGATIGVYGSASTGNPTMSLVESTQTSSTVLALADFQKIGSTKLADDIADVATDAYSIFTLNEIGLSKISLTGYSKFALRETDHDLANSTNGATRYYINFHLVGDTGYEPYLSVTYTIPGTSSPTTGFTQRAYLMD